MALDFPANPSEGDSYIAENGVTYTYVCDPVGSSACGWIANSQAGLDERYVNITGDNMTGDLTLGTDKITLNATDGSSTFAATVKSESPAGTFSALNQGYIVIQQPGTSANDLVFRARNSVGNEIIEMWGDGKATFAGSVQSQGNVLIGGALPNSPAISLNAAGGASFAGSVISKTRINVNNSTTTASDVVWSINTGSSLNTTQRSKADGSIQLGSVNGSTDTANIELNANGSATFAGDTKIGDIDITKTDTLGVINYAAGAINVQRLNTNSTSHVWRGYKGSTVTSEIQANGAATFAGVVNCGGLNKDSATSGGVQLGSTGLVNIQRVSGADNSVFQVFSGTSQNALIKADGSATFASRCAAYDFTSGETSSGGGSSPGMIMGVTSTGEYSRIGIFNNTLDSSLDAIQVRSGSEGNSKTVRASIGLNGTITGSNVTFNLEADDDTKYTTTTDADGNVDAVYNGAVLDVKDRLSKTDAALQSLKAALGSTTDHASLKAALITALADI